MSESDPQNGTDSSLMFDPSLHDRALAGWGIRRRRGDLAHEEKNSEENILLNSPEDSTLKGASTAGCAPPEGNPPVEVLENLDLGSISQLVASCERCGLCEHRQNTVFGSGDPSARLMFVGDAPGEEEDLQGLPFVGRSGQLLDRILSQGLKLTRDSVYITNVLKCRPPESRDPLPEEVQSCGSYLDAQIERVNPEMIVALGKPAAQFLTGGDTSLKRLRGRKHVYKGVPVVVTHHPAFLLQQPQAKAECWQDLQVVIETLGLK